MQRISPQVRGSICSESLTPEQARTALVDAGFHEDHARAMAERGLVTGAGEARFCFGRSMAAEPFVLNPRTVHIGAFDAPAPTDIPPDTYPRVLATMRAPRILVAVAHTGFGKTLALGGLIDANIPDSPTFQRRHVHIPLLGVAATIVEVRALRAACENHGMECVLYLDKDALRDVAKDPALLARTAIFTTYHSLVSVVRQVCGAHGSLQDELADRAQSVVTASSMLHLFDRLITAQFTLECFQHVSVGLFVVDECERVVSLVASGSLCNAGMVYSALRTLAEAANATVMMSANAGDNTMRLVRRTGAAYALYWHLSPPRPRRAVMYDSAGGFAAAFALAVTEAIVTGTTVMLFVDNKRLMQQVCDMVGFETNSRGAVLGISSPTGRHVAARIADGNFIDFRGMVLVASTGILSAAASIFADDDCRVETVFFLGTQIVAVTDVQQMVGRVRRNVSGNSVCHVHIVVSERAQEDEPDRVSEESVHLYYTSHLRSFLRNLHVTGAVAPRGMHAQPTRIDVASVVGSVRRCIAERYNTCIAAGLAGVAHINYMQLEDDTYGALIEGLCDMNLGMQYRRAVYADFGSMGFAVEAASAAVPHLQGIEGRLFRGMLRLCKMRRLSAEEEDRRSEVMCALRQAYSTPDEPPLTDVPECLLEARAELSRRVCKALGWRELPRDEEDARVMVSSVSPRFGEDIDAALSWLYVMESFYSQRHYAEAVRVRSLQGMPHFLDPVLAKTEALLQLMECVRLAACTCAATPVCATCVALRDGPLTSTTIPIPTRVTRLADVDSPPIAAFVAAHVASDESPYVRSLLRAPHARLSWKDFADLYNKILVDATGVGWTARFGNGFVRLGIHPSGAARVRCYVLAMRSRSTLQPGDAYAPMAASPQHRDVIRELDDRLGPFPPLDGTE